MEGVIVVYRLRHDIPQIFASVFDPQEFPKYRNNQWTLSPRKHNFLSGSACDGAPSSAQLSPVGAGNSALITYFTLTLLAILTTFTFTLVRLETSFLLLLPLLWSQCIVMFYMEWLDSDRAHCLKIYVLNTWNTYSIILTRCILILWCLRQRFSICFPPRTLYNMENSFMSFGIFSHGLLFIFYTEI